MEKDRERVKRVYASFMLFLFTSLSCFFWYSTKIVVEMAMVTEAKATT